MNKALAELHAAEVALADALKNEYHPLIVKFLTDSLTDIKETVAALKQTMQSTLPKEQQTNDTFIL